MATDYAVLKLDSLEELVSEVKKQIAAGWEPVGGIHVDRDSVVYALEDGSYDKPAFYQAMIKQPVTERIAEPQRIEVPGLILEPERTAQPVSRTTKPKPAQPAADKPQPQS